MNTKTTVTVQSDKSITEEKNFFEKSNKPFPKKNSREKNTLGHQLNHVASESRRYRVQATFDRDTKRTETFQCFK